MNKSLLIIIAITFMSYCSYGQTSVAVYNNNNANYYQKMFTSKVVIHITSIDNWLPVDKTDDYTAVLKNNPDYQKTSIATDEMLLKIALENGDDYICNLAIKTNLTINNIVASLVNIKTGLTEQKATATCSDLVSASSLDKAAQEIVDKLFLAPNRKAGEEANALAEQKANEERAKEEQKSKEEKAKTEAEKRSQIEAEKQAKIEAERGAKAKAEAEKLSNVLVADGKKVYSNGKILLKKNEVRALMANTDALSYYNKGIQRRKNGNALVATGIISLCGGISCIVMGVIFYSSDAPISPDLSVAKYNDVRRSASWIGSYAEWSNRESNIYNDNVETYDREVKTKKILYIAGGIMSGIGLGLNIAGPILRHKAKKDIAQAVNMYNGRKSTSHVELGFKAMPNGMSLTVKF